MDRKELSELRRRFRPDRSAIRRIYGCYVNGAGEIVSDLDEPLAAMPQEEAEKYLSLLKKALSGTLGKNLIDIVFSTRQVMEGPEHQLLRGLRESGLQDDALRQTFYRKVIDALDMDGESYLLLMAHDTYDVPYRSGDGEEQADASDRVFSYLVCCVCPVKTARPELGYFPGDNEFHCSAGQVVSPPELGFLFPAFHDRGADLYNALYYARKPEELHQEFIDAVFHTEPPMSAAEQREAFQTALTEALGDACGLEVAQAVHQGLRDRLEQHRESRDPEPLSVTAREIGALLADCGVPEERVAAFREQCGAQLGEGALDPANLIDSKHFQVKTQEAQVQVDPEHSYLVELRVIDGRRYLLLPADGQVEVNGLPLAPAAP